MRLLADWIDDLPLQQQAVLVLALRGPDGFPKHHPSKRVLYHYRACILRSAKTGRMLKVDEHIPTFMSLSCFDNMNWGQVLKEFREVEDELPLHYYTHLMHGSQILAYKHPDMFFRTRWLLFYTQCCSYLHVPLEESYAMNERLNDFGRLLEEVKL